MLLSVAYFAVAYWLNTLIDNGAPKWLYLIVMLCAYNAFKFIIFGFISAAHLRKARRDERRAIEAGQMRSGRTCRP